MMRRRFVYVGFVLTLSSCSSAFPTPEPKACITNEDCNDPSLVCSIEQGNVCIKAILPNRNTIGLVLNEFRRVDGDAPFVAEIRGSDASVTLDRESHPERFILNKNDQIRLGNMYPGIRDSLVFRVIDYSYFDHLNSDGAYDAPLLTGEITASQPSRLARSNKTVKLTYPPEATMGDMPTEQATIPWQHLAPTDVAAEQPLVVTIDPSSEGEIPPSLVHTQVNPVYLAQDNVIALGLELAVTQECQRNIYGSIAVIGNGSPPPPEASVSIRYASPVAPPSSIKPRCPSGQSECPCTGDDDCATGQVCNPDTQACGLDLTGRFATTSAKVGEVTDNKRPVSSRIYTYCDDNVEQDIELDLALTLTPSSESGLPRLTYLVEGQQFEAATDGTLEDAQISGLMCQPNWLPAQPVSFAVSGSPATVGQRSGPTGQTIEYSCCHINCIQGENPEPPTETSCSPKIAASFAGTFIRPDSQSGNGWFDFGCLPLYSFNDADEVESVRFTRAASCSAETDQCTVLLSPGELENPLAYDLRIEPEVGSIFRSTFLSEVEVSEELNTIPLNYRVLLRGRVRPDDELCQDQTNGCTLAREAEIMAERIRLPSEADTTVLGPFIYTAQTFDKGSFTLPVNPGVYLISAFPAIGTQGAPSRIAVVDLRLESGSVSLRSDGVPVASVGDLLLTEGRLATIELRNLDRSATITPLDLGTWSNLTFEAEKLELNDPETCYGADGNGCRIRQIVFNNDDLLVDQQGFVTFSSRD